MRRRDKFKPNQKYGKLTTVKHIEDMGNRCYWLMRCDCGAEKIVNIFAVYHSYIKSCGCLIDKNVFPKCATHGKSKTSEYKTWKHIKDRCHNKKCKVYLLYGARGIEVCERWRHSFENFLEDMGEKPKTPGRWSIGRIDNSKGYSPENCRWETAYEQSRNTRQNRWIECHGERLVFSDWAIKFNYTQQHLRTRLEKLPLEIALSNQKFSFKGRGELVQIKIKRLING